MIWALTLLPLALLVLRFPIYLILLVTSGVVILFIADLPVEIFPQVLFGSINKLPLIALPFFILAGELMAQGGIARRIVDWVLAVTGGVRGSLPLTAVGSCTVFGAVSGSSPATVAAIGNVMYGPLRDRGYSQRFAGGVLTSCGGLASVIPPSVSMILYGAAAQESVADLFIAGIVPGLLIAGLVGLYVYVHAKWVGVGERTASSWRAAMAATRKAALALLMPLIILGGIYGGIFTPTEAGGVACIYAMFVSLLIYREINLADLWRICVRSMYVTAQIFIVVAAAGVYSWLLTTGGVPAAAIDLVRGISENPLVTLAVINLFLLVVGCFIDPTSAIIVLTPLLVPIVAAMGIDLIHFGIIMVVNLEIGMFTPPFGLNIFVAQSVFKSPLKDLYLGLAPFIGVNLIGLLLVTYFSEISLFLTRLL